MASLKPTTKPLGFEGYYATEPEPNHPVIVRKKEALAEPSALALLASIDLETD